MAAVPYLDPGSRVYDQITDLRTDQSDAGDWSQAAGSEWQDAEGLHRHLSVRTNIVKAAQTIPFDRLLSDSAVVLDLGCGSGWLAGLLTCQPAVEHVIAWDASRSLLAETLPTMVSLVGGDLSKIRRVCGTFTPLLIKTHSVDMIAMSSAFHHSSDPDALLLEMIRVVKPRGVIVLLNEVPYSIPAALAFIASRASAATVNCMTTAITLRKPGHVAADHVLYDEVLGDRAMTLPQWARLFSRHDLRVEIVETSYPSYPSHYRQRYLFEKNLTHFVLRPRGA